MEAGQSRNDGNRAAAGSWLKRRFFLGVARDDIPDDLIRAIQVDSQQTEERDYDTDPEDDFEDEYDEVNAQED